MLKMPGAVNEPGITVKEPSPFGTIADPKGNPSGDVCGPVDVQFVFITLTVIVPVGVTLHDWVPLPPEVVVAVTVKRFETRDCVAAGVQLSALPLRVALAGADVSVNETVPPAGSVAAT